MSLHMTDNTTRTDLFGPTHFGAIKLANRIVMAPVTRSRYAEDGIPNELHATYYAQRASAGLIIAEATNISAQGRGYAATPGIWSKEQTTPRQSRVRGFISAYAISHQKSFYECWLTASELAELIGHVGNALTDADRFHCFELDPRMLNRLTGTARRISTEPFLVV